MMRATLFHNPTAGSERYPPEKLMRLLLESGFEAAYQSTKKEGWATAIGDPGELVIAAGGDGTIAKIAKGLTGRGIPLAILPTGTANNIASSLGITAPPEDLIRSWDFRRRGRLDIGVADGPWGRRRFIESVGIGVFSQAIALANHAIQDAFSDRADEIAWARRIHRSVLHGSRSQRIELVLDGEAVTGDYLLVEAMSASHLGPNIRLAPESRPGDGRLDVVLVEEGGRSALEALMAGRSDPPDVSPFLRSRRCYQVEIGWRGQPLHVDDEVFAGSGADPGDPVHPVGLRLEETVEVLVPPRRPLE